MRLRGGAGADGICRARSEVSNGKAALFHRAQAAASLFLRFAVPTLFSMGIISSLITALFSGILQAFLFFKLLIRYSRPVAQSQ